MQPTSRAKSKIPQGRNRCICHYVPTAHCIPLADRGSIRALTQLPRITGSKTGCSAPSSFTQRPVFISSLPPLLSTERSSPQPAQPKPLSKMPDGKATAIKAKLDRGKGVPRPTKRMKRVQRSGLCCHRSHGPFLDCAPGCRPGFSSESRWIDCRSIRSYPTPPLRSCHSMVLLLNGPAVQQPPL